MAKKLSEMTNEELWKLFPITLTSHKTEWEKWYIDEADILRKSLSEDIIVSHIGSTAIKNIYAKSIIDILIEIPSRDSMLKVKNILISSGYIIMNEESKRIDFNKGYTENGFAKKVYHLHLRYYGDNDELYFRDYMNDKTQLAKKYEELKLLLSIKYRYNRDAYTNAKGDFVKYYTIEAKKEYNNKYAR